MKHNNDSRQGKINVIAAVAVVFVVIVLGFIFMAKKSAAPADVAQTGNAGVDTGLSQLKTYTDPKYGFSFSYQQDLLTLENTERLVPPDYDKMTSGVRLVKQIAMQYCDLAERCTPKTDNINIVFLVINKDFTSLTKPLKDDFGGEVKDITIGGKNGVYTELGVEGEGIFQYYIPMDTTRTMLISRGYMSEDVLGGYKDSPLFIPYAEQAKIFDEVIKTFKF